MASHKTLPYPSPVVAMDAWQYAVQKHLGSLTPTERQAFMAPASVDDCMSKIQQVRYRHRRGYHRVMLMLSPVIEPLQRFQGAIDVLTQMNSGIASPIWGPLRAVITLASDRLATLQNLGYLLERIVEPLKRFKTYENIFKDRSPLRNAIGNLYCDLIDFCTRAVRFYGKTTLRTIFGNFDKEMAEITDSIRHHWTEIDIAANFVNITESYAIREIENKRRIIQIRGDVQRWLCPATVVDDLHRLSREQMPGSCNWFLDTTEYKILTQAKFQYSMRIVGRPGEGKTVLSSFIINHLASNHGRVLYFFCKAGDVEKRLPVHVMRTVLSQLLHLDNDIYPLVEDLYQNTGRPIADSLSESCVAFTQALSHTKLQRLFMVVDAIDECVEPKELIDALRGCQDQAPGVLHIVYTSRDHPDLRPLFAFCQGNTRIWSNPTKASINDYIAHKVSQMSILQGNDLIHELIPAVSEASDGLWLYARLILEEIHQAVSANEIRRLLASLPKDIRELYSSILSSAENRLSELQIRVAQQIFVWIDGADYMPWWHFHGNEILEDSVLSQLVAFTNGGETVFDAKLLISKICFPLVDVFDSDTNGDGTFAASFIHYSAEQYLQWTSTATLSLLPSVLRPRRLRNLHRCATATWYFRKSTAFKAVLESLRENVNGNGIGAYFEMAYGMGSCWHMSCLPPDITEEEISQLPSLLPPMVDFVQSNDCLGWAEAAILINYGGNFRNLVENVEKAIDILEDQSEDNTINWWWRYIVARKIFFTDFVYVLRTTGPGYRMSPEKSKIMPDGFEAREYAVGLRNLGLKYQYLVDEAPTYARPTDGTETAQESREWQRKRSSASNSDNEAGRSIK